jgi:glucose-6-phosphate 1-epimerase
MLKNRNLTIHANGAHVTSAETPLGDLFYVSSTSDFGEGEAIRGGVPIIAPWFAQLLGDQQHGWARRRRWEVTKTDVGFSGEYAEDGISLRLDVGELGNSLRFRLTATNTTDESRRVQLAYHPYFAVSDVADIHLEGLGALRGVDRASGAEITLPEEVTFDGLVDQIVLGAPEVRIVDEKRVITVSSRGADSTVIWNPGERKADGMPDIGPREWNKFVCVEPALLGSDQKGTLLTPGEINTLEMIVRVEAR